MKDAFGTELKVGDVIAYCTRHGSHMEQKKTVIREITTGRSWDSKSTYDVAICDNPNRISALDQGYSWAEKLPKKVRLVAEGYIVKVAI